MWVGSQATKPLRLWLALVSSPAAEVLLSATQRRLRLPSRRRAFLLLCGLLLGSTLCMCTTAVILTALGSAGTANTSASPALALLAPLGGMPPRPAASTRRAAEEIDAEPVASSIREHGLVAQPSPDRRSESGGPRPRTRPRPRTGRMSTQKAADLYPPAQDNIHGWKEHPRHLLGFWSIGRAEPLPPPGEGAAPEAVAAAAPSLAAAAALAQAEAAKASGYPGGTRGVDLGPLPGQGVAEAGDPDAAFEGFSDGEAARRDRVDLGSDILHHVTYVVLKRDGSFKAGPARLGVVPRSWRFTPANKRLVFEVDVPGRGVTLR